MPNSFKDGYCAVFLLALNEIMASYLVRNPRDSLLGDFFDLVDAVKKKKNPILSCGRDLRSDKICIREFALVACDQSSQMISQQILHVFVIDVHGP